jgi:hypothetical protein
MTTSAAGACANALTAFRPTAWALAQALLDRSTPVTACPPRLICNAIGKPIAPTPINVTFTIVIYLSQCLIVSTSEDVDKP